MMETKATAPGFTLNTQIDVDAHRREFVERGVTQIGPLVSDLSATTLRNHLLGREDWKLAVLAGRDKPMQFDRSAWDAMTEAQRAAIRTMAAPSELDEFRYVFEQIVVAGDDARNREPETILGQFAAFMSSPPMIELVKTVTGETDVACADARGTRYGPGDFLTQHNDREDETRRRAAYVFGLTEQWRPEWGGLLLFHDERGDIEAGKLPRMNILTLFKVPKDHSVSAVAPFAPFPRYSVTGWMRAAPDDPLPPG